MRYFQESCALKACLATELTAPEIGASRKFHPLEPRFLVEKRTSKIGRRPGKESCPHKDGSAFNLRVLKFQRAGELGAPELGIFEMGGSEIRFLLKPCTRDSQFGRVVKKSYFSELGSVEGGIPLETGSLKVCLQASHRKVKSGFPIEEYSLELGGTVDFDSREVGLVQELRWGEVVPCGEGGILTYVRAVEGAVPLECRTLKIRPVDLSVGKSRVPLEYNALKIRREIHTCTRKFGIPNEGCSGHFRGLSPAKKDAFLELS